VWLCAFEIQLQSSLTVHIRKQVEFGVLKMAKDISHLDDAMLTQPIGQLHAQLHTSDLLSEKDSKGKHITFHLAIYEKNPVKVLCISSCIYSDLNVV